MDALIFTRSLFFCGGQILEHEIQDLGVFYHQMRESTDDSFAFLCVKYLVVFGLY